MSKDFDRSLNALSSCQLEGIMTKKFVTERYDEHQTVENGFGLRSSQRQAFLDVRPQVLGCQALEWSG